MAVDKQFTLKTGGLLDVKTHKCVVFFFYIVCTEMGWPESVASVLSWNTVLKLLLVPQCSEKQLQSPSADF